MTTTLDQLQADADAISVKSPAIRKFAQDAVAYLKAAAAPSPPAPQPPPPSPPPQPSGALDDQRAIHMSAISSTGRMVDSYGRPVPDTMQQSQSPPGFWDSLVFTNNDVTLVADQRYGKVYRFRTNGDSSSPGWGEAVSCDAEIVKYRPIQMGQWDWYALAVKWVPGWDYANVTDWHSIMQFGYPTISSPPVGLYAGYGDNIRCERHAGLVTNNTAAEISDYHLDTFSRIVGHWYELLVGIRWGSNRDGEIHVSTRCKEVGEVGFTARLDVAGLNTWQWGGALNIPQSPQGLMVDDKLDSYWGYKPGLTDANITADYFLQHTGHVRCADKATALSYLP